MAKKITAVEVHYIESFVDSKSPEEIARDIGTTVANIMPHIEAVIESRKKVKPETATQKAFKQNKQPGSAAEKYGVTIMSPTASELGDKADKGAKLDRSDCIFRPKG